MDQRKSIAAYRQSMGQSFNNFGGSQLANSPMSQPVRQAGWSANGGGNAYAVAPQYILQISNSSNAAISNFDVFGASIYLNGSYGGATWSNGGNLTLNGVTISSVFGNVTYQQMLASSASKPFTSGGVYLQSIAGSTAQVTDVYNITSQTAGGELFQSPVAPILDGYQFNAGITYNNTSFNIEPLTKLTWSTIYPNAVFQIRIFPANIIDPSNALNGNNVQQGYSKPRVIGTLR
jgi:hypothetical protein